MKWSLSATAAAAAIALAAFAAPASAAITVYTATLTGPAESPPVASPGYGLSIVTVDDSAFTMRVQTVFTGLLGTTSAAHIHCCTAVPFSGTAGVATPTPTLPGFPSGVTTGFYDNTFDMTMASSYNAAFINNNGGTPQAAFATLMAGMFNGQAYLNIHTTFAPGGEIRGFYTPNVPIPEPGTYALMLSGLAAVGFVARKRKQVA